MDWEKVQLNTFRSLLVAVMLGVIVLLIGYFYFCSTYINVFKGNFNGECFWIVILILGAWFFIKNMTYLMQVFTDSFNERRRINIR